MAEYRDKLIEEYINKPFAVGEWVMDSSYKILEIL